MKQVTNLFLLTLLLVSVLFLVGTVTLAQTGDNYDLSWSSVDSGGGYSSGTQYELVGSIGQPDAGVLAGGDFSISGGFLQCAPPLATALSISLNNSDLLLAWSNVNASGYELYRHTLPYFTPTTAYSSTTSLTFTDVSVGNGSQNYYYLVRADDGFGCDSEPSNKVGAFSFGIKSGDM